MWIKLLKIWIVFSFSYLNSEKEKKEKKIYSFVENTSKLQLGAEIK